VESGGQLAPHASHPQPSIARIPAPRTGQGSGRPPYTGQSGVRINPPSGGPR
jgi:hypothetical protein